MDCRKCKKPLPEEAAFCPYCGSKQIITRSRRTRPNGAGTVYKRGKTWQAEVVVGYDLKTGKPKRRYKGGFKTRTAALEYLPTLKNLPTVDKQEINLEHYWAAWETAKNKLSKSKQAAYNIAWKKWEILRFMPVAKLTVKTLQDVVDEMAPTYYTARDMRTVMSHLFVLAIADEVVRVNLASYIVLPSLEEEEPIPFNEDELRAFWSAYEDGDQFVGYILLMIYTGMMPGELFVFRKSMIDWDKQEIVNCGIKTKLRKRKPMVIADFFVPILRTLCESTPGEKVLRMNRDRFYAQFDATLRRYGCRDLTPYACRHSTATALALGNQVAPSVIQRVMRHAKFSTTQRYIHPDNSDALAAVNTLAPVGSSVGSSQKESNSQGNA